jgi:membrane protein
MAPTTRARSRSSSRSSSNGATAAPGRWADRLIGRLPRLAREVAKRVRGHDLALYGSGLAFYALVSAAPLAIVVAWVASLILGDDKIRQLATQMQQHAPGGIQFGSFLQSIVDAGTSIGIVAVITALWPASSYGSGLRRAFDHLSPHRVKEPKGLRGRGLALLVLLPLFVAGSLAGSFLGSTLLGDHGFAYVLGLILALLTGFISAGVGVALIYRIFPPKRMPWGSIVKGTLFTAAAISVLSLAMTVFVNAAGSSEQQHFGSAGMALLVLFAVWLFLSNVMLLIGFVIAQED